MKWNSPHNGSNFFCLGLLCKKKLLLKLEYIVFKTTGIHTVEILMQGFLPVDLYCFKKGVSTHSFLMQKSKGGKRQPLKTGMIQCEWHGCKDEFLHCVI